MSIEILQIMSNFVCDSELITTAKYLETQLGIARREINNLRQQLKALSVLQQKEYKNLTGQLENWQCESCKSNRVHHSDELEGAIGNVPSLPSMKYIGTIATDFPEKRGTPRQPSICSETTAKITLHQEIFTNPAHALDGLEEFSHVWILFHFHKNDAHCKAKVSPPRLNGTKTGVLATRSPHRPNAIGMSLVKINKIIENCIYFNGVDMVDGTPVLDIKPYIPQYDNPLAVNSGDNSINGIRIPPVRVAENSSHDAIHGLQINAASPPVNLPLNNIRIMDGEENRRDDVLGATSAESSNLASSLDELSYSRLGSRIGEREAPDGEEEGSSSAQTLNYIPVSTATDNHVRVPSWINQSSVSQLNVVFKERALIQLNQLGVEGEEKKNIITNILREDPRSVYLRERLGNHCYVFRISELYVSCKFNDANKVVTVFKVSPNAENDGDD